MRRQTEQAISAEDLAHWISGAMRGGYVEYHRGMLTKDRMSSEVPLELRRAIGKVADVAWTAHKNGLVCLVQKSYGPWDYSYRAMRTALPAKMARSA